MKITAPSAEQAIAGRVRRWRLCASSPNLDRPVSADRSLISAVSGKSSWCGAMGWMSRPMAISSRYASFCRDLPAARSGFPSVLREPAVSAVAPLGSASRSFRPSRCLWGLSVRCPGVRRWARCRSGRLFAVARACRQSSWCQHVRRRFARGLRSTARSGQTQSRRREISGWRLRASCFWSPGGHRPGS